jgi:hypothetical protein
VAGRTDVTLFGVGDVVPADALITPASVGLITSIPAPTINLEARYPTPSNVGLPSGWVPDETVNGTLVITTNGATIQNVRVNGSVEIRASDVTLHRCRVTGNIWNQWSAVQYGPFMVEECDIGPDTGTSSWLHGMIGVSNYECHQSHIHNTVDAWRVSGDDVYVHRSLAILTDLPDEHADGLQCYAGGTNILVDNCTIDCRLPTAKNSAVFAADSSAELRVRNSLLMGGAYTIRFHQWEIPSTFEATGNRLVQGAWDFGPAFATRQPSDGSDLTLIWSDNRLVTIDENYQVLTEGALVSAP